MKSRSLLVFMLLAVSAFGQTADLAVGKYSENGKLIGLTNLSGLSDCPVRSVTGKVKDVKVDRNIAHVRLREKKQDSNIEIPLNRLSVADREAAFQSLVRKLNILRVAGYSCRPDAAISAFSIDRIY